MEHGAEHGVAHPVGQPAVAGPSGVDSRLIVVPTQAVWIIVAACSGGTSDATCHREPTAVLDTRTAVGLDTGVPAIIPPARSSRRRTSFYFGG